MYKSPGQKYVKLKIRCPKIYKNPHQNGIKFPNKNSGKTKAEKFTTIHVKNNFKNPGQNMYKNSPLIMYIIS